MASRILLVLLRTLWLCFHAHLLLTAIKVLIVNKRPMYRICTAVEVLLIFTPTKCSCLLDCFSLLSIKELNIIYSIILYYLLVAYLSSILDYKTALAECFPLQGDGEISWMPVPT